MSLRDKYDFANLANQAEDLVFDELERQLNKRGATICSCEECVLDMAAHALNNVKPVYRVSLLGRLYAQSLAQTDYENTVIKAVSEAVKLVSANPTHE